jgi:hypothetical protein
MERKPQQGLKSLSTILESLQERVDAIEPKPRRFGGLNVDFIQSTIRLKVKRQEKALDILKIKFLDSISQKYDKLDESMLGHIVVQAIDFIEEHGPEIANIVGTDLSSDLKAQTCISLITTIFESIDLDMLFELVQSMVGLLNRSRPVKLIKVKNSLFRRNSVAHIKR